MPERKTPTRTIKLVRPPDDRGIGVLAMTVGGTTTHYTFREIRCDIGGRGFAIHRMGVGTRYDVRIGAPADTSCECLGFLAHGRCKHVAGLRALLSDRSDFATSQRLNVGMTNAQN
jgi:hypothetical protein